MKSKAYSIVAKFLETQTPQHTPGCVTVAPLTVIFAYFLFRVNNYLDMTEMRPARRWKALILYFMILISFKQLA